MDLDWTTILFEIVNFVILLGLLTKFLFKPVRRVLAERRKEIGTALEQAESARADGESLRKDYESRRGELEDEAATALREARERGEEEAAKLIERSRDEMLAAKKASLEEIEQARTRALDGVRPGVGRLAVDAARAVIRGMDAPEIAVAYARRGAERLAEELGPELAGARIRVGISEDANLYDVSLALEQILGTAQVDVSVDPELVGGVRLSAPGLEVESSAGRSIDAWLEKARDRNETVRPRS